MTFNTWLDTLISEKDLDLYHIFKVRGALGLNRIPLINVIDLIKRFDAPTQRLTKIRLVEIDFKNGSILDFFRYLAKKMAI